MKKYLLILTLFLFSSLIFSQTAPTNTRFVNPTGTFGFFYKSFVKHLNSNKDQLFYTTAPAGNAEYFGTPVGESRMISRLDIAGLPLWTAAFYPESNDMNITSNGDFATTDMNDNFYVVCSNKTTSATLKDAAGTITNFSNPTGNLQKILVKLDSNGNKVWTKIFDNPLDVGLTVSLNTNSVGDLYMVGYTYGSLTFEGVALSGTFIVKISGTTGNILYSKVYPNYKNYNTKPVFDAADNLYIFSEPLNDSAPSYVFDGVTIPSNADHLDNLMLKFDASGTCIFGKNFYETMAANSTYQSWFMDVVFDGTDFIAIGDYASLPANPNFLKLDGTTFTKHYPGTDYEGFLAKISTSGNVVWEKALESFNSGQSVYTNINLDSNKAIYGYFKFKTDLYYQGVTYPFDTVLGDKTIIKFDNNGNLLYNQIVDKNYVSGNLIDVFGVDKYNVLGSSLQSNFLLYPITNSVSSKNYVATFGALDGIYLRPINNYTEISNVAVLNNPSPAVNEYSFLLLNNVPWTATSDQSWLNLGFVQLSGKNASQTAVSGNGDAKIILTAAENTSGISRSANVLITGTGVPSKTVTVTQTGILATGENSTLVTTVYPNPTSDFLNIKSSQKISKIEIYDMSGKLVKSGILKDEKINVQNLSKGNYLLKIQTENGVVTSKFIKN